MSSSPANNGGEYEMSKFVRNLHEMISDDNNAQAVGFSPDGFSLEIRDTEYLSLVVLPKYFKHGNISSLTRQLNNYGFKTNPPRSHANVSQSFTHPSFCRGRADLYGNVKRRPAASAVGGRQAATPPDDEMDKKIKLEPQFTPPALPPPPAFTPMPSSFSAPTSFAATASKPSYQQLLELNFRLQQQNSELEEHVRQLEEMMRTKTNQPAPQSNSVQPQFLMHTSGFSQQLQQQPMYRNNNPAMRISDEQGQRLFPAVNAHRQNGGGGGIRSSGEQARSLFGEEGSSTLEDDDVVALKNMFLRTSMDEDQPL